MAVATDKLPPIRGFLESTLIDWPGRIASILFLPGCNLRCAYCHAGPLLEPAPEERIAFDRLAAFLSDKRDWIDGVVVCGGEPTLHPGLPELCRALREMGFGVKLDTNGTRPQVVGELIDAGLIDAVSMDLKTTADRFAELTRSDVDPAVVDASLRMLAAAPLETEFRTTCCPAFVDEEVVTALAGRVAEAARAGADSRSDVRPPGYVLQRFEAEHCLDPAMREVEAYNLGRMESLLEAARAAYPHTRLRGA